MKEVPIWEKTNLTLEEAAAYSGIGINKLREITNNDRCDFVGWNKATDKKKAAGRIHRTVLLTLIAINM